MFDRAIEYSLSLDGKAPAQNQKYGEESEQATDLKKVDCLTIIGFKDGQINIQAKATEATDNQAKPIRLNR